MALLIEEKVVYPLSSPTLNVIHNKKIICVRKSNHVMIFTLYFKIYHQILFF